MSAIGSVIVIVDQFFLAAVSRRDLRRSSGEWYVGRGPGLLSPRALGHPGQLAAVRHVPQADPAEAELAEHGAGTPAPLAAGVAADAVLGLAGRLDLECCLGH